jgi:hypothetical protein
VVITPATGRGISASYVGYARTLLLSALHRTGRFLIVDFDRPVEAFTHPPEEIAALARGYGAPVAISLDLSRDAPGDPVRLTITCTTDQAMAACDLREIVALGPSSLPALVKAQSSKLVALLLDPPRDEPPSTRPRLPFAFGAKSLLLVPLSSPLGRPSVLGGVGLFLSFDHSSMLIDFGVDFAGGHGRIQNASGLPLFNKNQYLHTVGVDLRRPWWSAGHSPYVGLGIAGVVQRLGGRGARGLQARSSLGFLWGRHTWLSGRLEAGYFVDLFSEQQMDRLLPRSDRRHLAHGLLFSAGVSL